MLLFFEDVMAEVLTLFLGHYIHVGGDRSGQDISGRRRVELQSPASVELVRITRAKDAELFYSNAWRSSWPRKGRQADWV